MLYDIEHRPVTIPKATFDILLKEKEPLGLLGLYTFYYYTAVWQNTNSPRAVTSYAAKGLKISATRIRRYKSALIELGLVEDKIVKNDKGQVVGHYIKVRYYQGHTIQNPQGGKSHRVEKRKANALSTNKRNALRNNTVADKSSNDEFDLKCSNRLHKALLQKRKICRKVNKSQWVKQFKKLRIENNLKKKKISEVLKWYCKHIGEQYMVEAFSADKFCKRFDDINNAMEKYRLKDITPDPGGYELPKARVVRVKKKRSKK